MQVNPPAPGSREHTIIRTLLAVDAKGIADGGDILALEKHGIDIMTQLGYLIDDPLSSAVRSEINSNVFHIALNNWANNVTPPTTGDPE